MKKQHYLILSILAACQSPDKLLGDSNVFNDTNDTVDTVDTVDSDTNILAVSISQLLNGEVDEGTFVSITDVEATTPSSDSGVYVAATGGGTNSGIWVSADFENKGVFSVEMGNSVNVMGYYEEPTGSGTEHYGADDSLSTVRVTTPANFVVSGDAVVSITPINFDTDIMSDPSETENYEGSYIEVLNPTFGLRDNTTLIINNQLVVDESFVSLPHDDLLTLSTESIRGVLGYKNGEYVLHPRTLDDVNYSNISTGLNASNLFFSEVLTYETSLSCCGGFQWYLELYYHPSNSDALDISTLFLKHVSGSDVSHAQLVRPDIAPLTVIEPGDLFLVSSDELYNCLMDPNTETMALALEMESVSGMSGGVPSSLAAGDEVHVYYAPSESLYANGHYVLIDTIVLSAENNNATLSIQSEYDGNNNDLVSVANDAWCLSSEPLYDQYFYSIYDYSGGLVMGSPGSIEGCIDHPDTANISQGK